VIDRLVTLPPHVRERLAGALESGVLSPPYSHAAVHAALASGQHVPDVMLILAECERLRVPSPAFAVWVRSVEKIAGRTRRPDLVWTGPEVAGLAARDTRSVYEELLGSATKTLWASTYAFFDGPRAFDVLAKRMDTEPRLAVSLLLNIQRKRGDTTASDHLVRRFTDRFWGSEWPGTRRPGVYYDPRSLEADAPRGVLHAKAVVADDEVVFVTSANLTEAALDRNIEMGLLVRDRALAASVSRHFRVLIDRGLLVTLPSA
jgi:phosphatidylserine/phosphatidylglycerophosphate/cardiolipin synthase-like enzyme